MKRPGDGRENVEIRYLDQGLHRTSQKMAAVIQEQLDQAAAYAGRIESKENLKIWGTPFSYPLYDLLGFCSGWYSKKN